MQYLDIAYLHHERAAQDVSDESYVVEAGIPRRTIQAKTRRRSVVADGGRPTSHERANSFSILRLPLPLQRFQCSSMTVMRCHPCSRILQRKSAIVETSPVGVDGADVRLITSEMWWSHVLWMLNREGRGSVGCGAFRA
ncbi:MAG: hypothetical protein GY772_30600 [bacterium]|nr:hypothetical protein [bacterium]